MADTNISDDRARTFASALQTFEKDGDVAAFAALFTDAAATQRLEARGERRGEVEQFWQEYRAQFDSISTTFYDGNDKISKLRTYYDSAQFAATTATTAD